MAEELAAVVGLDVGTFVAVVITDLYAQEAEGRLAARAAGLSTVPGAPVIASLRRSDLRCTTCCSRVHSAMMNGSMAHGVL